MNPGSKTCLISTRAGTDGVRPVDRVAKALPFILRTRYVCNLRLISCDRWEVSSHLQRALRCSRAWSDDTCTGIVSPRPPLCASNNSRPCLPPPLRRLSVCSGGAASAAAVPAPAGKSKGSSVSTATFNLVKNILGAGVLSLPAGVAAFSSNPYVRPTHHPSSHFLRGP